MKPIKPKKMPKVLERFLRNMADWKETNYPISPKHARQIVAALEYERQRADDAEKKASTAESELSRYKPQHWHD